MDKGQNKISELRTFFEKLMAHFTREQYVKEVLEAKKEFAQTASVIDEEADDFEAKADQFFDWYFFVRPHGKTQKPLALILDESQKGKLDLSLNEQEVKFYKTLLNSQHSLYVFLSQKPQGIMIRDVIENDKLLIQHKDPAVQFEKNQIFSARVISLEEVHFFVSYFCFHSIQVTKFIKKEIKKLKKMQKENPKNESKAKQELIWKLFCMHHKCKQYAHVEPLEIYTTYRAKS